MAEPLVLLTGATGMIGFSILVLLLKSGYRVRAAVRTQAGFDRIAGLKAVAGHVSRLECIIVPDICVPGAYDEAVRGVIYVIHVASPIPDGCGDDDHEASLIRPAIQGTVGMLESACKEPGIERLVLTASVASLGDMKLLTDDDLVNEDTRRPTEKPPWPNLTRAYLASKSLSFKAAEKFMAENKPPLTLINILPTYTLGRDERITEAQGLTKGSNKCLLCPLIGIPLPVAYFPWTAHIDDVATAHIKSLDSALVPGNQNFIITATWPKRQTPWADAAEIVKRRYPNQVSNGTFDVDAMAARPSLLGLIDSSRSEKALGMKFKTFEEAVTSLLDYYLELIGQEP